MPPPAGPASPSLIAGRLGGADTAPDRAAAAYAARWLDRDAAPPDLEAHWAEHGPGGDPSVLAALIKVELAQRAARGEALDVAAYLDRFPALRGRDSRVLSLIYEEFCLREDREEDPDPEEFCARFAAWKDSLREQLRIHRMVSRAAGKAEPGPRFPEAGERFLRFDLRRLLGKGGVGRVYLAREDGLGDRAVVLKITPDRGEEASIQGRLNHPHIVPVLSVGSDPGSGLRGLCMPFLPGLTLEELLQALDPLTERTAVAIRDAVAPPKAAEQGADAEADAAPDAAAWSGFPEGGTYCDGVAWIARELALALGYAHRKNVFHRDVKAANVLLSWRGGPQLLDFNLAHDPKALPGVEGGTRGGTLPYMAPEQLEAFFDPGRWDDVGREADIYSLGLLVAELLAGPEDAEFVEKLPLGRSIRAMLDRRVAGPRSPRAANPAVPHALEAIVVRCLQPDAAGRYRDAESLAEDLRRYLARLPLQQAVNPSRREVASNWARRNRPILAAAAAALLGLTCLLLRPTVARLLPIEWRSELHDAIADVRANRHDMARRKLLGLIVDYPQSPLPLVHSAWNESFCNAPDKTLDEFRAALDLDRANPAFRAWMRDDPNFPEVLSRVGRELQELHESRKPGDHEILDYALTAFLSAVALDPSRHADLERAALTFECKSDTAAALDPINRAIDLASEYGKDPRRYENTRGRLLLKLAEDAMKFNLPAGDDRPVLLMYLAADDCLMRAADWLGPGGSPEERALNDVYRGRVAYGKGVLTGNRGNFERTDIHLKAAETLVRRSGTIGESLLKNKISPAIEGIQQELNNVP